MGDIAKKLDFDASFVEQHGEGFEEFRTAMLQYTPEWASEKCGVPIDTIYSAARGLVKAAPHCHVDVRPARCLAAATRQASRRFAARFCSTPCSAL